ncbi:MAG: hypothetical protein PHF44_03430 [Candidatus Pacebacteria bacterium]|nr:hypothetical protein [Candidatus Paceibacterota bacterium]
MKALEFHFNPEEKDNLIFDSFCYEPENIYEKRLGALFMVGELKNALPHNYRLLERLSSTIKKEYYSKFQRSNEAALKTSLKEANEFLSEEVAKENTDWLGNLSFAILSLKGMDLNFTKIGALKIFLLRGGHIIDIGSKLDLQDIEPYPLKIFNNIVSGGLSENDLILILTKEVYGAFKIFLEEIAKIFPFDEKKMRELLKTKSGSLSNISGVCLIITLNKDLPAKNFPREKTVKTVFQKEAEKFSIKKIFAPLLKMLLGIFVFLKKNIINLAKKIKTLPRPSFHFSVPKIPVKMPSFSASGFKIPKIGIPHLKMPKVQDISQHRSKMIFTGKLKKNLILVSLFLFTLLVGFIIFRREEQQKLIGYENSIEIIRKKIDQAESFLLLKNADPEFTEKANSLFLEIWQEVLPMANSEGPIKPEALEIKEIAEKNLKNLNNLIEIENPEIFYEIDKNQFIPQKIVSDNKNLYLFSPYSQNLFKISENKNGEIISYAEKLNSASLSDEAILFFIKPDKIYAFKDDTFFGQISLTLPASGSSFSDFTSFWENIYFLDKDRQEIIRYLSPISEGKDNPQIWLKDAIKPKDAKSISVDGSVWVLDGNNSILKYHSGYFQEEINLNTFPKTKLFSKIYLSPILPYIYILEPAQNRIIIANKAGKVIKQFQSEKFDNLLDFSISEYGNIIWLLNGNTLFKVNF